MPVSVAAHPSAQHSFRHGEPHQCIMPSDEIPKGLVIVIGRWGSVDVKWSIGSERPTVAITSLRAELMSF